MLVKPDGKLVNWLQEFNQVFSNWNCHTYIQAEITYLNVWLAMLPKVWRLGVTISAAGGGAARLLTEQECKELTRMINFVLRRVEEIRRGEAVLTFDIPLQRYVLTTNTVYCWLYILPLREPVKKTTQLYFFFWKKKCGKWPGPEPTQTGSLTCH